MPLLVKETAAASEIEIEMEVRNQNVSEVVTVMTIQEALEVCTAVKNNDMDKVKQLVEVQKVDINLHSGGKLFTPLRKHWE